MIERLVLGGLVALLASSRAAAEGPAPASGSEPEPPRSFLRHDQVWHIEIPIWIPGYRGTFAYGDVSLEGEDGEPIPENPIEPPDHGNIFSRLFTSSTYLKFFFMGQASYSPRRWLVHADAFTGHVGESIEFRFNEREVVQANFRSTALRGFLGYSVYEWRNATERRRYTLYPYTGARVHFLKVDSDLNRIVNRLDLEHSWGEFVLGVENRFAIRRWLFVLRGDWGNSFAKDNNSYMINFAAYWRMGALMSLKVGWTDWGLDVTRTVAGETMILDTHLSGPSLGLGFHF